MVMAARFRGSSMVLAGRLMGSSPGPGWEVYVDPRAFSMTLQMYEMYPGVLNQCCIMVKVSLIICTLHA